MSSFPQHHYFLSPHTSKNITISREIRGEIGEIVAIRGSTQRCFKRIRWGTTRSSTCTIKHLDMCLIVCCHDTINMCLIIYMHDIIEHSVRCMVSDAYARTRVAGDLAPCMLSEW